MSRRLPALCLLVLAALAAALLPPALQAGGFLTGPDFSAGTPGPVPGSLLVPDVPIRWDDRLIPVPYLLSTTLDPIPNPFGLPPLPLDDAAVAVERAMASWNGIPTSYIELRLAGRSPSGSLGVDNVNLVSFQGFPGATFLGVSIPFSLTDDLVFSDGQDLDGDGDADVVEGLATWSDIDGDGDFELPAGLYPAGTIVENDVLMPDTAVQCGRWRTTPSTPTSARVIWRRWRSTNSVTRTGSATR